MPLIGVNTSLKKMAKRRFKKNVGEVAFGGESE